MRVGGEVGVAGLGTLAASGRRFAGFGVIHLENDFRRRQEDETGCPNHRQPGHCGWPRRVRPRTKYPPSKIFLGCPAWAEHRLLWLLKNFMIYYIIITVLLLAFAIGGVLADR